MKNFIFFLLIFTYSYQGFAQCPTVAITPVSPVICGSGNATLTANTSGGTPAYTYLWNTAETTQSITVNTPGTYTVTVSDNSSCAPVTQNIIVTAAPIPDTPVVTNNGPICTLTPLYLFADSITNATYSWTGPGNFTSNERNPVLIYTPISQAGIYSVTVTVNGCTSAPGRTNVVLIPAVVTPPGVWYTDPACTGRTLYLHADNYVGGIYTWSGPNGFSGSTSDPVINNITFSDAGNYTVVVAVNGCPSAPSTLTVVIKQTPPSPSAPSSIFLCENETLNLTAGNVAGATYMWTIPNGLVLSGQTISIPNVTSLNNGTYGVTATVDGCISDPGQTVVNIKLLPQQPSVSSNSPICEGGILNLSASFIPNVSYSWTGPNSFTSATQNPFINNVSLANAGIYNVSVNLNGCTSSGSLTVIIQPIPSPPTPGNNGPLCIGQTLNLTASNIPGANYFWTGPNSFTSTLQNPLINNVTPAAAGKYYVSINVNGCISVMDSTTVFINPATAVPTAGNSGPDCEGATLNLTATTVPNATYSWTGPNGFTSNVQNPVINNITLADAGVYNVSAIVNGCASISNATNVVVKPLPATPSVNNNGPLCVGTSLNLTANNIPGATYSWIGPNGFTSNVQNPVVTNVALADAGTYNVIATVNGCTGLPGSTIVVVNPIPSPPTANNNGPLCVGTTLNLNAGNIANATYNWSGPNSFTSNVQNPVRPNIALSDAGFYNVTVTVNGCTSSAATTSVIVNPSPLSPLANNNGPLCVGQNLNLFASNIPGATYSWAGPNSFTSTAQNPMITNVTLSDAGIYNVTATVNGCSSIAASTTAIIKVVAPTPTLASNSPICSGGVLNLSTPLIAGVSYNWSGPNGFTSTLQNPVINNITVSGGGSYTLTLTGCNSASSTINVIVNPIPSTPIINTNSPLCKGQTLNLTANSTSGSSYNWSGPNGFTSTLQNPVINNVTLLNAGTYSAIATLNGCMSSPGSADVVINDPSISNAGNSQTVCADQTFVNLAGTITGGSSTGIWSTNGSGTFSPNSSNLNTAYALSNSDKTNGSVLLTLTSTNNGACPSSSSSLVITILNAIVVNAGSDQSICASDNSIGVNGQITTSLGTWSTTGSGTFSPSALSLNATYIPSAADKASQSVMLILTSISNGSCKSISDTMILVINPGPSVNAGPDKFVLENATTILEPVVTGTNLQYLWTPNLYLDNNTNKNPVVIGINDQLYTLVVTDNFGCSNQDEVFVKVLKNPKIPNTFTPNNDGINDTWIITNLEAYPDCRIQVFNRYGQLVFESKGYTKPWDGTRNNKALPFGTYYYVIEPGSSRKPIAGYVTIIK